ncbi:MAG: hypothetical protein AAF547_10245 [Actinomycetota bacterium]
MRHRHLCPPLPGDGFSPGFRRLAALLLVLCLTGAACSASSEPEGLASVPTDDAATAVADGSTSADGTAVDEDGDGPRPEDYGFEPVEADDVQPEDVSPTDFPDLPSPEEATPVDVDEVDELAAGEEVLDSVEPVDTDGDVAVDRDGRVRNSSGELIGLDEPASLACANVELALTAIDEGDLEGAAGGVATAADWAGQSEMPSVQDWQSTLAAVAESGAVTEVGSLVGFLTACAQGGYEL